MQFDKNFVWNHGFLRQCTSFIDIMEFICAENKEPELFPSVTWALWSHRNNLRLGKQAVPLDTGDIALTCVILEGLIPNRYTMVSTHLKQIQSYLWRSHLRKRKKGWPGSCYTQSWRAGNGLPVTACSITAISHRSGGTGSEKGYGISFVVGFW